MVNRINKAVDRALDFVDTGVVIGTAIGQVAARSVRHRAHQATERVRGYVKEHSAPYLPAGHIEDVVLPDSEDTSDTPPIS